MGSFVMSVMQYAGLLSELVGCKAGLALNRDELHAHMRAMDGYDGFLGQGEAEMRRMRSEQVQTDLGWLLFKVGRIDKPGDGIAIIDVYHRYKRDPHKLKAFMAVSE